MEIVTRYRAGDGHEFSTEDACRKWERWIEDLEAANQMLRDGASLWDSLVRAHVRCGWDWEREKARLRDKTSAITRETPVEVLGEGSGRGSWFVCSLEPDGTVRFGGEGVLGWWSKDISLVELARESRVTIMAAGKLERGGL